MGREHIIMQQINGRRLTVNLPATATASVDAGKLVKLVAKSEYGLCALGDPIEGQVISVELASVNGKKVGSIEGTCAGDIIVVTANGLQATPGVGTIAVGDYVVAAAQVAIGTSGSPLVVKATAQPTATPADFAGVAAATKTLLHPWRVISLGTAGTGAVGTDIAIQRM